MAHSLNDEIAALQAIRHTPGLGLIHSRLQKIVAGSSTGVPLDETNWTEKAAHAQGYTDNARDLLAWLEARVFATTDEDGTVHRGVSPKNPHPPRYPSVNGGE